jgi:TPP-dependent pyruvate/acetoin dehydrogenase alpha subunit
MGNYCSFTGEGATSEGDFHEALNIASVWELPVMFVMNNGMVFRHRQTSIPL